MGQGRDDYILVKPRGFDPRATLCYLTLYYYYLYTHDTTSVTTYGEISCLAEVWCFLIIIIISYYSWYFESICSHYVRNHEHIS